MPPTASKTRQIDAIQGLRAFAALIVALGHMLHEVANMRGAGAQPPSLFETWTGSGVDIFFVISGFVMVYASQGLFSAPGGARTFLARRIARIVPLYWLMTTAFLTVMLVLPSALSGAAPTITEILKSYFFIPYARTDQALMQPVYKLGWTLNYELFFYCVFAGVIALPVRRAVLAIAVIFFAIVLAGWIIEPQPGLFHFWSQPIILEFVWGAGLALLALRGIVLSRMAAWALIGLGFAGFGLWSVSGIEPAGLMRALVWGAASAAIVAGAAFMPPPRPGALSRVLITLGDASYAIYLWHPMMFRALRLMLDKAGLAGVVPGFVFVALSMALTLIGAVLLHKFFEKPMTRVCQRYLGVAQQPAERKEAARTWPQAVTIPAR